MIGTTRKHSITTESTNLDARDYIRKGAPEGTLVTADFQTKGRGRRERRWVSAHSESVLASYILYPKRPLDQWGGLPLIAGLAVVQALNEHAGVEAHLKWPNDVLVNGRKISGILVESGSGNPSWAIAGIGINVNQMVFEGDFRQEPTSLYLETEYYHDIDAVIQKLSKALDEYYALWSDMGNEPVLEAWKQHSMMIDRPVSIVTENGTTQATARDLGDDGALIVEYADGTTDRVYAADVTVSLEKQ